ncbi:MarR family transcriptional regulator [Cryptosporangium japonicum]|uniref:MarR family winged helix-turn-helix transcriptional regulator n=1 Tax=Cryptosporangium japonicum TaxID=80872 RepID=UPI0031D22010
MPTSVNALDLVLELTVLLGEDMTQSLASDHLTEPRAHLLWVLGAQGPSTQKSLAEALNVSARNITGLVDGLEQTGYVIRAPHPDDRRATLVSTTERGAAIVDAFQSGQKELAEQLFGPMAPGELDQFVTSLTGVVERLRAAIAEGRPA